MLFKRAIRGNIPPAADLRGGFSVEQVAAMRDLGKICISGSDEDDLDDRPNLETIIDRLTSILQMG